MVGVVGVVGVVELNKKPALKVASLTKAPQKISALYLIASSYQVIK